MELIKIEKQTIYFKDLSIWLKVLVILCWINIAYLFFWFALGFIIGIVEFI